MGQHNNTGEKFWAFVKIENSVPPLTPHYSCSVIRENTLLKIVREIVNNFTAEMEKEFCNMNKKVCSELIDDLQKFRQKIKKIENKIKSNGEMNEIKKFTGNIQLEIANYSFHVIDVGFGDDDKFFLKLVDLMEADNDFAKSFGDSIEEGKISDERLLPSNSLRVKHVEFPSNTNCSKKYLEQIKKLMYNDDV